MRRVIVDTGPLVALFDRNDPYHGRVSSFWQNYTWTCVTTWLVITEASHLLSFNIETQLDFYRWIRNGGLTPINLEPPAFDTILELSIKYRDRPIDLADASLLVMAMETDIREVVSLDSDFDIYRLPDKSRLKNLLR